MTTLHTISRAAGSGLLQNCIDVLGKGDGLLFIEDGVYHCPRPPLEADLPRKVKLYGLREDCQARGLVDRIDSSVRLVNNRGFVQLCCEYDKVINWF